MSLGIYRFSLHFSCKGKKPLMLFWSHCIMINLQRSHLLVDSHDSEPL